MPESRPDGALVGWLERAVRGDPAAREALLEALYVPLRRYARRQAFGWIEPDEVAKDVAQDALIRITARLDSCHAHSDAQVVSWALAIARNVLIDRAREHPASVFVRLGPACEPRLSETTTQDAPSHGDRVLRRVVRSVLRALPADRALLLKLRLQLGERWTDVGAELGTTWCAARRRFQRLQASLRKDLTRRVEDLPPEEREAIERRIRRFLD
jgi:RNA polymerase sigma factor (sigma-70 family)